MPLRCPRARQSLRAKQYLPTILHFTQGDTVLTQGDTLLTSRPSASINVVARKEHYVAETLAVRLSTVHTTMQRQTSVSKAVSSVVVVPLGEAVPSGDLHFTQGENPPRAILFFVRNRRPRSTSHGKALALLRPLRSG